LIGQLVVIARVQNAAPFEQSDHSSSGCLDDGLDVLIFERRRGVEDVGPTEHAVESERVEVGIKI